MFYSPNAHVRKRQITGDVIVVVVTLTWFYIGYLVHRLINELGEAGKYLGNSGADIKNAGSGLGSLSRVTSPLNSLGNSLSSAGASQVHAVHRVAFGVGLIIALGPSLPVLIHRIGSRLIWMKSARLLSNKHTGAASEALLAQRALIHQPLTTLLSLSDDPVADVTAGNTGPYAALERDSLRVHLR